jgi:hypothetical protein
MAPNLILQGVSVLESVRPSDPPHESYHQNLKYTFPLLMPSRMRSSMSAAQGHYLVIACLVPLLFEAS